MCSVIHICHLFLGSNKKDSSKAAASNTTHRGSIVESTALGSGRSDREKVGSGKRSVRSIHFIFTPAKLIRSYLIVCFNLHH